MIPNKYFEFNLNHTQRGLKRLKRNKRKRIYVIMKRILS